MDDYYVEFIGELKDDQFLQGKFFDHYNAWCDVINSHLERLNDEFDKNWSGEPIQDYWNNSEYHDWMLNNYRRILVECGLNVDLFMQYEIGEELELIGIGRWGRSKYKRLSFVLKKRA